MRIKFHETDLAIPSRVSLLILYTNAESGAYSRDSSRCPRRRPYVFLPHTIGSVPILSGHAIAYRWHSLPRVRWHRASSPQGSSSNGCCLCITMDQLLLCAFLFPSHFWYKVSLFKLPGVYQSIRTAVLLYCFVDPFFPSPTYACTNVKSQVYTVQYHPLCVKALSRLYYCYTVNPFPAPPTHVCTSVKSLLYTVQYRLLYFKT